MAFQLSPGVEIKEIDLTSIIPAVSTTRAGFAGLFDWGPVGKRISINSENDLYSTFRGPNATNFTHWFTAANFLGYGNNLQTVRVLNQSTSKNASSSGDGFASVLNSEDYEIDLSTLSSENHSFIAKYPGSLGNSLRVSVSDRTHIDLNPIVGVPGTSRGFLGSSTSTSDTSFLHTSTNSGVVGSDLLRFKKGTPKTLTGYTASLLLTDSVSAIHTMPASVAIGTTGAALAFNTGKSGLNSTLVAGDYISVVYNGDRGYAFVAGITNGTTKGTTIGIGASGFGFAAGATSTSDMQIIRAGVATSGVTFPDAGITAASLLWKYHSDFNEKLPNTTGFATRHGNTFDMVHAIVVDEDGVVTGTKGTVLEKFAGMSKAGNAFLFDGSKIYYKDYINANSRWIWWGDHLEDATKTAGDAWGTDSSSVGGQTWAQLSSNYYVSLTGGTASAPAGDDYYTNGYDLFADPETVDISILIGGPHTGAQAQSIADMVGARKDCVAFFSPPQLAVITATGTAPKSAKVASANVIAYRDGVNANPSGGDVDYSSGNLNISSSYCVLDSGWKYMYDRYNDVFRFVPLSGDIAGIAVRSDQETETWFSPAGFNRGQVRGVVKLAYNPVRGQRDDLYSAGVNPVVSFPGEGTVLFGDKTMQSKPSAFDRINVRRLFIVLEKAIATASKFKLFELNDAFTRASFRQMLEPFLRDIQARRGIIDFKVVCDDSNNTAEIIDRNEFVADIYIKPTRSINFITLNFIATKTGVDFNEIGGSSN